MATAPVIEHEEPTSIVVAVAQNPALVLVDTGKRDDLFAHIRSEIEAFVPDITTVKGRDAIKSFAYKITRTKTAIDDAGKKLNEEARARINVVDAARRDAKEALDAMAKEVRQPLTEWEEAENVRISGCRDAIAQLKRDAVVTLDDTAATVRQRGMDVWNTAIDEGRFGDLYGEAMAAKEAAVASLKSALDRLTREEAERAELERLRAEAAERAEADRLAEEERQRVEAAKEKARQEAEEAAAYEARRAEREKEVAAEMEREKAAAAEQARKDAEQAAQAAQAERDRIQREHEEAIAAERRRAEEAEAAAEAERKRIADEEAARQAEAQRLADEQAAREKDKENRRRVKTAAKEAIMSCGASEDVAQKIVLAIIAGEVPAVSLRF